MSQIVVFPHLSWTDKQPSKPVLNNFEAPQIQILKYMGNKRRLLKWLAPLLRENLELSGTVLDLFAGTSSIGYALKPYSRIIANDIQAYSAVISSALLEFNERICEDEFKNNLLEAYNKNFYKLFEIFGDAIEQEERLINTKDLEGYNRFSLRIPNYSRMAVNDKYNLNSYSTEEFIQKKRVSTKSFPYILFSTYYPSGFFSLKQCIEIDSLRYAIDRVKHQTRRTVYLSCLMYAMNRAVNSTGHFAEYLNQNSLTARTLVLKQRMVLIIPEFLNKLSEFRDLYIQRRWKNKVYNYDYKDLIRTLVKNKEINNIKLIYIDPPYTGAQYSRFYHLPETLVKYDYPRLTFDRVKKEPVKGGYRDDRYQSPFSQFSKVEYVFREMFDIISANTNAVLAISYSDNSLLRPIEKLMEIAKQYYEIIDKQNGYSHSAQGSRFKHNGQGNHKVNEYLLICRRK